MSIAIAFPLGAYVAAAFGPDKHLLAEQAWCESQWDPLAVGDQRSLGLMAIPSAAWAEWAPTLQAFDPERNLRVAAAYRQARRRQPVTRLNLHEDHRRLVASRRGFASLPRFVAGGNRWADRPADIQGHALSFLLGAKACPLAAEPVSVHG